MGGSYIIFRIFFQDAYPHFPPIWCSESEVAQLMDIMEKVNAVAGDKHLLFTMIKFLVIELYKIRNEDIPKQLVDLRYPDAEDKVNVVIIERAIMHPFSFGTWIILA